MKTINALSVASVLSTTYAQGWGSFAVVNRCPFDLYLWSVPGGGAPSPMITLPGGKPQIGYKEQYRTTPNLSGVSLKVAPYYGPGNSVPPGQISQLEYTVPNQNDPSQASVKDLIFYDLSWVNGDPFEGIALTMQTSMGATGSPCPSGTCGINQSCDVGYLWSTDDVKTHACALSADVIWTFCSTPGGSLNVKTGLIGREADPEPAPAPAPAADADPLAVCVQVGGDGIAELCPDAASSTSSSTTSSSSTTPPPATTTSAAPIVALQKPASSSTTTSSSAAPVASAPVPINNPSSGPVSLSALTNIQNTGVTTWLSYNSVSAKRDLSEHSAHRHSHQAFHRRKRIVKST